MNLIAAAVGVTRIQKFLGAEEMAGVRHLSDGGADGSSKDVDGSSKTAATANGKGRGIELVEKTAAVNGGGKAAINGSSSKKPAAAAAAKKDGVSAANGSSAAGAAVAIEGGSFAWDAESPAVLDDVTLTVPRGALAMIVGPVGSGKSSLLAATLGEMVAVPSAAAAAATAAAAAASTVATPDSAPAAEAVSGAGAQPAAAAAVVAAAAVGSGGKGGASGRSAVTVAGSVAYTAQDAWIQNATLKNNILMGLPYDVDKYQRTIDACCLEKDLEVGAGSVLVGKGGGARAARWVCNGMV
jgi:hypothetical protein